MSTRVWIGTKLIDTNERGMKNMVIGVTGGVGSGKTTVAKLLECNYNASLILADDIAKLLMRKGEEVYTRVVEGFGSKILDNDGNIDNSILSKEVFSNPDKLKLLNSITHPAVISSIKILIENMSYEGNHMIVLESAMLIETGLSSLCDKVVAVVTDNSLRTKRLLNDRGYSKEKTRSVMNNQKSNDWIVNNSDYVIHNNSNVDNLEHEIDNLIVKLEEIYGEFK